MEDLVSEIRGKRAGSKYYHCGDGFFYIINSADNTRVYLKCINFNNCPCTATMPLDIDQRTIKSFRIHGVHNHAADENLIFVTELRERILKRCQEEVTELRVIFEQECASVPREVSTRIGFSEMKSAMYRARRMASDKVPQTLTQFAGAKHGNADLLCLSAKDLHKNKRIYGDHFFENHILPSGRLKKGAVPLTTGEPLQFPSLAYSFFNLESAERDNGLPEGQQNENFKNSEELLTSQQVESTMDFEPQTAFAPVGSIKEEALEITDDSNSLNTYSEELNVNNLNLMPETYLENTPVSHHFIKCEPEFPPECQVHEKTQTDTHTDPQEDYYIGPSEENLTSKIGKEKLIGTNNDFTNLKNVVRKLENISDRLAFAAIADQYEQFGKYLATLLRGIPQKKLLSLKQKLIFDVIQAKMALDESERPSPATDNCSVSQDEYGNVVNLNAFQRNASGTFYRNDNDLPKQENIPTRNSVTSKVTPVVPTSLPLTTFDSNFLRENEENKSHGCSSNSTKSHRKRQAKSIPPNKCLKKPLTEHVQDQLKHTSIIDETVLEDMEEAQFGCLEDSCSIEIQEAVGASETCTEGPSGCSVSPDVCSDNQLTPRALSCESCNLDFSSSIDMKRHFMITHPGEIPSFKKMFSAENPVESSKTYFQELTDTSPATFGGQVEPHFETKKIMKGANVECLQKELRAFLSQTADNQQAVQQQPAQATGRARCLVCPRSKDIKTKFKCEQCYLPMCKRHMKSICNQCLVGIIK